MFYRYNDKSILLIEFVDMKCIYKTIRHNEATEYGDIEDFTLSMHVMGELEFNYCSVFSIGFKLFVVTESKMKI